MYRTLVLWMSTKTIEFIADDCQNECVYSASSVIRTQARSQGGFRDARKPPCKCLYRNTLRVSKYATMEFCNARNAYTIRWARAMPMEDPLNIYFWLRHWNDTPWGGA